MPYSLYKVRDVLTEFVAIQMSREIQTSQLSSFEYLCKNYSVVVDDHLPEFIFNDTDNSCIVCVDPNNDRSVIEALAHLSMRHYLVQNPDHVLKGILQTEADLFVDFYYKNCNCSAISL